MTFDPGAPYAVDLEDVEYACPSGAPLLARIYRPRGASGRCAALVDVHGGAWTYFDRTVDAYFDTVLAACGLVVAAIDFRQGAAHPHPAAVDDVLTGIRFMRSNAERFGTDAKRVGLIGGSSGGHLVLLAALRADCPAPRPIAASNA